MYRCQKCDYESMRTETLKFAKEKYFNVYSDTLSVQENFNLITSFIQEYFIQLCGKAALSARQENRILTCFRFGLGMKACVAAAQEFHNKYL